MLVLYTLYLYFDGIKLFETFIPAAQVGVLVGRIKVQHFAPDAQFTSIISITTAPAAAKKYSIPLEIFTNTKTIN